MTLGYDPFTRLYQVAGAATTRFAYDGLNMIAEYNGSNALQRRHVFAPGLDRPIVTYEGATVSSTTRRFLSADERGSIISITDSTAAPINLNRYDEYGIPAATNAGRFQYTGQAWIGELGLYYYKARIYSPTLGRFLQTDPIRQADNANLYAYVWNDPINFVDPLGLEGEPPPCNPQQTGSCDEIVVTKKLRTFCDKNSWLCGAVFSIGLPANQYPGGGIGVQIGEIGNQEEEEEKCIKPTDGPVRYQYWGGSIFLGLGGGFGKGTFSIPSIGARGTFTTGGAHLGIGGSLGWTYGSAENFGHFSVSGFGVSAGLGIFGGTLTFAKSNPINVTGGAATVGALGEITASYTGVRIKTSNIPIC